LRSLELRQHRAKKNFRRARDRQNGGARVDDLV